MTEIEIVVGYSRGTKSIEWIYIIKEIGLHDMVCSSTVSVYILERLRAQLFKLQEWMSQLKAWHWRPERFLESHGEVPEAELWWQWEMAAAALTSKGQRQADKEQQFLNALPEPLLVGTIHSSGGFLLYLPLTYPVACLLVDYRPINWQPKNVTE